MPASCNRAARPESRVQHSKLKSAIKKKTGQGQTDCLNPRPATAQRRDHGGILSHLMTDQGRRPSRPMLAMKRLTSRRSRGRRGLPWRNTILLPYRFSSGIARLRMHTRKARLVKCHLRVCHVTVRGALRGRVKCRAARAQHACDGPTATVRLT